MSFNNITPFWMLCNPYKIPHQEGYYVIYNEKRLGPFRTYEQAVVQFEFLGGKVTGKKEWLE